MYPEILEGERMRWVVVLAAVVGCEAGSCPAANAPRADDEPVSGATVDGVIAALAAQPFGEVALDWRDGEVTTATGSIEVIPGTGRRVQRPDCLEACDTTYKFSMACGPDQLYVDARGVVSTADGRLADDAWEGALVATALDGPLVWGLSPEPIPVDELEGTLDVRAVAEIDGEARDLGVRVFLQGIEGQLETVSFDAQYEHGSGDLETQTTSALGATPSL